jgi:hypothetical protein
LSFLRLAFHKYVSQYVVINTNIANKHSIVAVLLHFSVAVATHISLASHTTRFIKPHIQCEFWPSQAGLNIVRVIRGWLFMGCAIEAQALLTFVQEQPFRLLKA